MAFTIHPVLTSQFRQRLVNLGPGPLIPASEVKVYHVKKNGELGHLIRIEDREGKPIEGQRHGAKTEDKA